MRKVWTFSPHAGGKAISALTQIEVRKRIAAHAEKNYAGKYNRIDVRFHGALCYVDAYVEPVLGEGNPGDPFGETREEFIERERNTPVHLCRMRHFADGRWSVAFYTYSHDRYEPCIFLNGEWFGTPEDAFDIGAAYLR